MIRTARLIVLRWPRVRGEVYSWAREIAAGMFIVAFIVSAFLFVGEMG